MQEMKERFKFSDELKKGILCNLTHVANDNVSKFYRIYQIRSKVCRWDYTKDI